MSVFDDNGLASVKRDGKWGFINAKGEEVVPPQYDSLSGFAANGLALIKRDGKYGYINTQIKEVLPPLYEDAGLFASNGLANVKIDGKWGYINVKGEEVISPQYDTTYGFSAKGLAAVELNGKWGAINAKGQVVIPIQHKYAAVMANGLTMIVRNKNDLYLINTKGFEVNTEPYEKINEYDSNPLDLVLVKKHGKYGFINEKGVEVIATQFEKIDVNGFNSMGFAMVERDGEWGFINTKGQRMVAFDKWVEQQKRQARLEQERAQREQERQDAKACDGLYVGKTAKKEVGFMFGKVEVTLEITGVDKSAGLVSVKVVRDTSGSNIYVGDTQETSCATFRNQTH